MRRAVCQRQLSFFSSIAVEHEDENFKSIALVVLQWLDMAYFWSTIWRFESWMGSNVKIQYSNPQMSPTPSRDSMCSEPLNV